MAGKVRGPDLDRFLDENKKSYVTYEKGCRMYGMNYYPFVRLCREAGANIRMRKGVVVDLDILDEYIEAHAVGEATDEKTKIE